MNTLAFEVKGRVVNIIKKRFENNLAKADINISIIPKTLKFRSKVKGRGVIIMNLIKFISKIYQKSWS